MRASSVSRLLKRALPALVLAAVVAGPAAARVRVEVAADDTGHTTSRVHVSGSGVVVERSGERVVVGDSSGASTLVVDSGAGMVRLFSDARVPRGERLDGDVVAVFGSVHVAGHVTGSAVAVFGSVDFEPGASVDGDAVAVGGVVEDREGVRVSGQTVSIGLAPLAFGLPGIPIMLSLLALGWVITIFFGWIFSALFPERLARVAVTSSRRTLLSIVLGLVSFLAMPLVSILLVVTVVGLPIGIMLPFAYLALLYAGQIAGSYVLGSKLTRHPLGAPGAMPAIVAGNLLVGAFFAVGVVLWHSPGPLRTVAVFFHLVGLLVVTGLSLIGTGAFLLSRLGTRPIVLDEGATSAPGPEPGSSSAEVIG